MDKKKNTYDDFSEYIENNEKAMQMLVKMSKNQNECIKKLTQNEKFEMLTKTKRELDRLAKENQELKLTCKDLQENQNKMQGQLNLYDKLVNTIGFTGEDVEIAKAVRSKCFKLVKNSKNNDLYILFYSSYSNALYAGLKKEMKVRRYSMIHTTKFNDAKKYIQKWKPSEAIRTERIQKLQDLNSEGKLNETPSKARTQLALERYLERINGGTTRYAIQ